MFGWEGDVLVRKRKRDIRFYGNYLFRKLIPEPDTEAGVKNIYQLVNGFKL